MVLSTLVVWVLAAATAADGTCDLQNVSCLLLEDSQSLVANRCDHPVRLALVGAGTFATKVHLPSILEELGDCFELTAIWSRTRDAAEALALRAQGQRQELDASQTSAGVSPLWGHEGWQALLSSGVEVVDLVLPFDIVPGFLQEAFASGVHVVSEKPAAPTAAEGWALRSLAKRSGVAWAVLENWRFEAPFRTAARMREGGQLGETVAFEVISTAYIPDAHPYLSQGSWRAGPNSNWILDVVVHMIAAIRLVVGQMPSLVHVSTSSIRGSVRPFDTFAVVLAIPGSAALGTWLFSLSSARAPATGSWGLSDLEMSLLGTQGALKVTRTSLELRSREGQVVSSTQIERGHSVSAALRAAALGMQDDRGMDSSLVSPSEAIADVEFVEAILQQATKSASKPASSGEEL